MSVLKINIFTPKNSWMFKYSTILYNELSNNNYQVNINNKLSNENGDIAFYLSYPYILKKEELTQHSHNIVVHASKLPHGKGWSPASWQILEGKNTIPITLFEADEKVDSGIVYIQDEFCLNGTELIDQWQNLFATKIVTLCKTFIENYPNILQKGKKPTGIETFYSKRTPKDSELNIYKNIAEQFNLLRIVDNENYPAFFYFNNKKYIIKIYTEDDYEHHSNL